MPKYEAKSVRFKTPISIKQSSTWIAGTHDWGVDASVDEDARVVILRPRGPGATVRVPFEGNVSEYQLTTKVDKSE